MNKPSWRQIAQDPVADKFAMKVTPTGIQEMHYPLAVRIERFLSDLGRIGSIVTSEAKSRIFDKVLGILWLLIEPIIMAGLYFFITTVVFSFGGEQRQFLFILTAVIFWRWFSRTIDGSPLAIVGYAAVLKQTRFPVIMVVLAFMGTELFFFAMSMVVLIFFLAFYGHFPNFHYVYLPIVMVTQFSMMLFFTLVFSAMGTFVKDLGGLLYAVTSVWWYLSPGIYPVSKIPEKWMWVYLLNPFAHILPAYRDIMIDNTTPNLLPLLAIFCGFTALSILAIKGFNWVRYYFFSFL